MIDILIKNGTVVDGTGTAMRKADVAVQDGKIVKIAPAISSKAKETINAEGKFVAPGFIDIQNHSDSYWTILDQPDQQSLLSQGITTIVMGNCGASLAPLLTSESIKTIQKWHSLSGININWSSMAEFLDSLGKTPTGVNVATLVGHATLRRGLVGDQIRQLNESELKTMNKVLSDALAEGAFGLSMGLVYAHEVNSSMEELDQMLLHLKPVNKYLSIHLRSEGSNILDSIDEVIHMASKSSVPVKVSHLKVRGKNNWHFFDRLMSKLEIAYHQGINISFDVYPYSTSWSVLYTYLPKWAYEGGRAQILKSLADSTSRRKILDYLKSSGQDFDGIIISEAEGNNNFIGKSLLQIGNNMSVSSQEAVLRVIAATNAQATVFDHNLSDEQVELLCASPLSFISSDGAGYSALNTELVHPRCFGTMTRFLRMLREKQILSWDQGIKKMSLEPAKLLGIDKERGSLEVNKAADIVVFDPLNVTDKADYKNPNTFSDGIDIVVVNGKISFSGKTVKELNGEILRR